MKPLLKRRTPTDNSIPTCPSDLEKIDARYSKLASIYRRLDAGEVGPGQKATITHGLELARQFTRWGYPLFPAEPASIMVAVLQREIDILTVRMRLWEQFVPCPSAERMFDYLADYRAEAWQLMDTYSRIEVPTEYTQARDLVHYETLTMEPVFPMAQTGIDYKAIREAIDIVEYIGRYVEIKRIGGGYKFVCPLHDDKNPSAHIYVNQKRWWCFVCNTGGDVIDFERARTKNDRALPK